MHFNIDFGFLIVQFAAIFYDRLQSTSISKCWHYKVV